MRVANRCFARNQHEAYISENFSRATQALTSWVKGNHLTGHLRLSFYFETELQNELPSGDQWGSSTMKWRSRCWAIKVWVGWQARVSQVNNWERDFTQQRRARESFEKIFEAKKIPEGHWVSCQNLVWPDSLLSLSSRPLDKPSNSKSSRIIICNVKTQNEDDQRFR